MSYKIKLIVLLLIITQRVMAMENKPTDHKKPKAPTQEKITESFVDAFCARIMAQNPTGIDDFDKAEKAENKVNDLLGSAFYAKYSNNTEK